MGALSKAVLFGLLGALLWQPLRMPPKPGPVPWAATAAHAPARPFHLHATQGRHVLGFGTSHIAVVSGSHALTMIFDHARPIAHQAPASLQGRRFESFTGTIRYQNPWPGVTVVYRSQPGALLKSEYRIAAGADPKVLHAIRIVYNHPVALDERGNLTIPFAEGAMQESAPVAWQDIRGRRQPVAVHYQIVAEKTVGFSVGTYDPSVALVIDPSLTWNTFLGTTGNDHGRSIAVGGSGNLYICGQASTSWGAPIRSHAGATDAFVAKLDSAGHLLWSTFLGGAGYDAAYAIAVSGSAIFVAGYSDQSWGSPVRGFTALTNDAIGRNAAGKLLPPGVSIGRLTIKPTDGRPEQVFTRKVGIIKP